MENREFPEWLDDDRMRKLFEVTLPRISGELTDDKFSMLCAYSEAMIKRIDFEAVPNFARIWRAAALYAGNGLGLHKPVYVGMLDILIECGNRKFDKLEFDRWPFIHLKDEWEISEDNMPKNYPFDLGW